ncbi:MAG TPA: BamA/TamA family outer membrane protein, partial [Polyangiaceae bacterium]|nr:BamA/TamA family outer membrane protein [Polyangiaceae bacterium]
LDTGIAKLSAKSTRFLVADRMGGRMRRGLIALLSPLVLSASTARAQAVRTWGEATETLPDGRAGPSAPSNAPAVPPEPPPATIGTPVPGSTALAPTAAALPGTAPAAVAPVFAGSKYTLEGLEVRGNTTTLARVVLRYVPFHAGDVLDVDDRELELTRFRLLSTGFFRDVQLSLRRGTRRGFVVLVVSVSERNTIVVDGLWLGVSADVAPNGYARPLTAYGGAQVTETNLAGTGVALGGAFAVADSQLALRARLAAPQFLRTSWDAEAQILYNAAVDVFGNHSALVDQSDSMVATPIAPYKRFGGLLAAGHDLGISSQVVFGYRLEKIDAPLGSSILSTIGATFIHDTRDEPFLPTRGHHIVAKVEASLTPFGSDYPYGKVVLSASKWLSLSWGHVLHIEGFAGAVVGTAPIFDCFYVGDLTDLLPDRVLDLNFDRRPALNFLRTEIVQVRYGNYAAKVDAEYRVPLYRGARSIYGVDLFGRFGLYGLADNTTFSDRTLGYTGLRAVPVDITFNAGIRIDTQAGGFVFGVSNLVGLGLKQGAARP